MNAGHIESGTHPKPFAELLLRLKTRSFSTGSRLCKLAASESTIPVTFRAYASLPRSWPPPSYRNDTTQGSCGRKYRPPTPFGPPSWAQRNEQIDISSLR